MVPNKTATKTCSEASHTYRLSNSRMCVFDALARGKRFACVNCLEECESYERRERKVVYLSCLEYDKSGELA
jgi:hypothetical protein